jgi:ArsR family transcriptional regulator
MFSLLRNHMRTGACVVAYAPRNIYVKANVLGYTAPMPVSRIRARLSLDRLFRALADPTRLRLLHLMSSGEICVCFLVEILRTSQPKISRHLAYLRRAGLVAARRDGKWMHYRLVEPADHTVAAILDETLQHLGETSEMQRDAARLRSACCPPSKLVRLQSAPIPAALRKR